MMQANSNPIGLHEIRSSIEKVTINVRDRKLGEVLQQIQKESGIVFEFNTRLKNLKITAHIFAPDWTSAVRKLLEDFSRVEVWDKNSLGRVRLLGGGNPSPLSIQKTSRLIKLESVPNTKKKIPRGKKYKIFLSENQLRELLKAPIDQPIPTHLFHDVQYKRFLRQFGLESPQELKDMDNSLTVRLEVRRQLRELKEQRETEKLEE
ncbi:MAG: hypothetical protein ACE5GQ_08315 [Nitrospinales bacterium]